MNVTFISQCEKFYILLGYAREFEIGNASEDGTDGLGLN
jgi:hypothetical protein